MSEFNYNPFLLDYLATFLTGNSSANSMAKALIYPRILGTSITTSFGSNIQNFCSKVLPGYGSIVQGIDIEFIDQIDGRRKYCQVKAGPQTINKDDIKTIKNHFKSVINLGRTNNLKIEFNDLIVGVLYGTKKELSANYKKIQDFYPVYIGKEFWYRLTGDKEFYFDLIESFGNIAEKYDATEILESTVNKLTKQIQRDLIDST